jgi:hypothetical protein
VQPWVLVLLRVQVLVLVRVRVRVPVLVPKPAAAVAVAAAALEPGPKEVSPARPPSPLLVQPRAWEFPPASSTHSQPRGEPR